MKTHMSGDFIAVIDIDYEIPTETASENSIALVKRAMHRKTVERMDEITNAIRETFGITMVFMPQYIEGMMLD